MRVDDMEISAPDIITMTDRDIRELRETAIRLALRDGSIIGPKRFMGPAREAAMELCVGKIRLCGSDGMA